MRAISMSAFILFIAVTAKGQDTLQPVTPKLKPQRAEGKPYLRVPHGTDHFGIRSGFEFGLDFIKYPKVSNLVMAVKPGGTVGIFHYYLLKHFLSMQELSFSARGGTMNSTTSYTDSSNGSVIKDAKKYIATLYYLDLKIFFGVKLNHFSLYAGPIVVSELGGLLKVNDDHNGQTVNGILLSSMPATQINGAGNLLFELGAGTGYEVPVGKLKRYAITFDLQFNHALTESKVFTGHDNTAKGNIFSYYDEALLILAGFRF